MSVHDLLLNINAEDKTVPLAIEKVIPRIEPLVNAIVDKMKMEVDFFILAPAPAAGWVL